MSRQTLTKPLAAVKTSSGVPMGAGDWLQLEYVLYQDNKGIERRWERCIRRKQRPSDIDAIDIHAILLTPKPEILFVVQYRPAIERYWLIDSDESDPVRSAQRELKEETGYYVSEKDIQLLKVPVAYEPGLSNSCCYVAKVTIDITQLTELPVQELEPDEWSLQTISLPLDGLLNHLLDLEKSQKGLLVIDSRVHALATGLAYAHEFI
ncbi:hypothetical protein MFLAVUS_010977 [Mucor flavus]|uniref:Nudix hydrolase domain-containing protein n=1 Tax=Mucor flavus TaxID=439312 RepID=A0ABP9ZEC1_9FUNG